MRARRGAAGRNQLQDAGLVPVQKTAAEVRSEAFEFLDGLAAINRFVIGDIFRMKREQRPARNQEEQLAVSPLDMRPDFRDTGAETARVHRDCWLGAW